MIMKRGTPDPSSTYVDHSARSPVVMPLTRYTLRLSQYLETGSLSRMRTFASEKPGGKATAVVKAAAWPSGTIQLTKIDGGVSWTMKSRTGCFTPAAMRLESFDACAPNTVCLT